MKIAFIGLGMMGRPMAERLLAHGFDVRVCDTNAALAEDFPEAWRATPREAAEDCELVVTMLPNGNIVSEVLTGSGGLLKGLKPGQIVVDCSSSDAAGTVALGKQLASEGVVLVDAPVSGGVPLAKEGKLTLMVGGAEDATFTKIVPVLDCLGARVMRVGGLGAGHAAKAINMAIAACTMAATCEGLAMGERFGIDPEVLLDVINSSTGRSMVGETVVKNHILTGTYAQGFALALMAKDVATADSMREHLGLTLPMLEKTHVQWDRALEAAAPGADFSEINKFIVTESGANV
ncbi:MAG: NAD(P)-dependent oxidoreductase [Novosphingobium sp.]|nr:NAD(P)-dependent oxidoreductase [Novosphingobium sp.]